MNQALSSGLPSLVINLYLFSPSLKIIEDTAGVLGCTAVLFLETAGGNLSKAKLSFLNIASPV